MRQILHRSLRLLLYWFFRLLPRLVGPLLVLIPLIWLGLSGFNALLRRMDAFLAQSAPLVSSQLTAYLKRPVTVGKLLPGLTVRNVYGMVTHPDAYTALPIEAADIRIGNRPGETQIASSERLGKIERLVLYVSLPSALTGDFSTAIPRVLIDSPELNLVRDRKGHFNVLDLLPEHKPTAKPQPPFRTVVEVENAVVHFRDYSAAFPEVALPAINDIASSHVNIDLTGAHRILIGVEEAYALPGSPTAARLRGRVTVSGTLRRGTPAENSYSPPLGTPILSVQLGARDVDLGYWLPYFVRKLPVVQVKSGRGDADIALLLPDRDLKRDEPFSLSINAAFRRTEASFDFFTSPMQNAMGTLELADGLLRFSARATVLGKDASATGAVWNIPSLGTSAQPNDPAPAFQVVVNAPQLPVQQAVAAAIPKGQKLPPQLALDGTADVQAEIGGIASGNLEDLTVTGRIAGLNANWRGLPGLRNAASAFRLADGVLQLTQARASLAGGGAVKGDGAVRLFGPKAQVGNAAFSGQVAGVDLSRLTLLQDISRGEPRARLRGIGNVEVIGNRRNGRLTAAANVTTRGLYVGRVPVPVAQARVLVVDNQVTVPEARLVSPAGVAEITGQVTPSGNLQLRFNAATLDLATLGPAVGLTDTAGSISAAGTISGTLKQPLIRIAELVGMNLRLRVRSKVKSEPSRLFRLDLARARDVEISPQRLRLYRPLELFRFPASAIVTGEIRDLFPSTPGAPLNPRFNLIARVENLDYTEIERQLAAAPIRIPGIRRQPSRSSETTVATEDEPPGFSGSIASATIRVGGTLAAPQIVGQASLGPILVGTYPLSGGNVTFDFNKDRTRIRQAAVTGTIGTLTATATIAANGNLSGNFTASDLQIQKLSYLTNGLLGFDGTANVEGRLGGSLKRPFATASISIPTLTVAGTSYSDFKASDLRFAGGENGKGGIVSLPELTFARQKGGSGGSEQTLVQISGTRYNLTTGEIGADLRVTNGDIATVLEIARRSGLDETKDGAQIARAVANLPERTDADFNVHRLAVRGRIVKGKLENPQVDADIDLNRLIFGRYSADQMVLKGTLRDRVVNVTQFEVRTREATIRGEGTYDPDGQMDAFIESNGASLDIISSLPGLEGLPLRGTIDFSLSARGDSKNPRVNASVLGRDLIVLTGKGMEALGRPLTPDKPADEHGLGLSLVRVEADLVQSNPGQYNVVISDALVKANDEISLTANAIVPIATTSDTSVARRPLQFNLRTRSEHTNTIQLRSLADYLLGNEPVTPAVAAANAGKPKKGKVEDKTNRAGDVEGTLTADIAYGGSLENPSLSGTISIADGRLRLPRNGGNDRINPISDFEATLRLAGSSILFDQFQAKLGGINGRRGDFGTMGISGAIQLKSLADLEKALTRRGAATPATTTQISSGNYDLAVTFDGVQPTVDNLLGFNEGVKGKIDGTLRVTGDLQEPLISTLPNAPLKIVKAEVRMPKIEGKENKKPEGQTFSPRFNVALSFPETNVLTSPGTFRFEVKGTRDAEIRGRLFPRKGQTVSDLTLNAEVAPQGGYFDLKLSRFTVQRQGSITVAYGGSNPRVVANEVRATTKIARPRGSSLSSNAARDILTSNTDATTATNRYTITVTLNGPLSIFEEETPNGNGNVAQNGGIDFSSDPPLSDEEILALIGGKNALDQAQQGQVQTAFRDLVNQAFYSAYLPGLVSQFTGSVAQTLGLEDLTIDYNADEPVRVRVVKRLPDPFNRFIVDYTRAFQQRNAPTQLTPYTFSFSYELYQFSTSKKVLPRLQLGFQTDEQRNYTYFLRGSVSY